MTKNLKFIAIIFLLIIAVNPLFSQVKRSQEIVLGNLQLKDEINLGMVFNGAQFEYRYGWLWEKSNNHEIFYQPKIGFGMAFTREMIGVRIHTAPVNLTWTMPFHEKNGHTIRGGANFKTHYNYYYYELHDGHLFWFTQIGVSPLIQYGFQWDNRRINAALQNSLFGFTYFRHRQGYDPYVWMFDWKDWVFTANKNLKFGSFNRYNHTTLSLEFVPNIAKRHSIGYEFDYLGFYEGYHFHQINHNLIWRVSLCGRKKQK